MKHSFKIQYENVLLRPVTVEDIEHLREWRNCPDNSKYLRKIGHITSEQQKKWFTSYLEDPNELMFAIEETKDLIRIVGSLSLYNFNNKQAEFGKLLIGDSKAHGKHIGVQATMAVLQIGFHQLNFQEIKLNVYLDNKAAIRVYELVGFKVEVTNKKQDNKFEYTMSITKDDFMKRDGEMIDNVKMLEFPQRGDERGHLVIVEGGQDIPFDIKRAFYIYGSDNSIVRGKHANRKSEFVLINVAGTSKVRVDDGRGNTRVYDLNRPHIGIYLPQMV